MREAEIANLALTAEISERRRMEAELVHTAFHDGLTQLRNRVFFMDEVKAALDRQQSSSTNVCSVLFIDLDSFKSVNDSLGHAQGDALLLDISDRLRRCVDPGDTLARVGGDEFAVLIEGARGLSAATTVAERIREEMRAPLQLSRARITPSCSIGIAQSVGSHWTAGDLVRDADLAMYEAKRSGRGDYAVFDKAMHDEARERMSLQVELRLALERNDFHVVYQPVFDPVDSTILSFEALIRWDHPIRGTIAPGDFIPLAEEIGLIREIDRIVLVQACRQLREWHRVLGTDHLGISVNVSAVEFLDPALVSNLLDVVRTFAIPQRCLEIEITEGIFLNPTRETAEAIEAVRRAGFRVALDDFGTGYSSLSYVSRYPINTIKIDKVFIDPLCSDKSAHAVVELIATLGQRLGLDIIAEGVETQEQADELVSVGCRAIQGYLYSRPLPADEATRLLERSRA